MPFWLPSNQNGCVFASDEEIQIRLKNTGIIDINTFEVQYTINNSIVVTETVNQEIKAGETLDYTFNEKADLSSFGNYNIDVKVIVADDQNPANDELSTVVVSADATIRIEIKTDQFSPVDNSWILKDSDNNIVASAGIGDLPYEEVYIVDVCVLTSECYSFRIYDEYGDGLTNFGGPSGYLKVYYNGQEVGGFSEDEANFGSEFTIEEIGDGCTVSLSEFNSHNLKAYPNPVSHLLFVENVADVHSVRIVDMLGRESTSRVIGSSKRVTLDFSNFENGLYLVKINSKMTDTKTILIQKR